MRYNEDQWIETSVPFGYKFLYLPELAESLHPAVLHYMLPGQDDTRLAENMYQRVQNMVRLGDKTGFLYKQHGLTYFREIPESPEEGIMVYKTIIL